MGTKNDTNPSEILELGKLSELRNLLIGLNQAELERLQNLISDPHVFAEEISELLPYAVRKLIEKGELSVDNLQPFIEDAMHKSIQNNPKRLADILFPIMGPAIRKAVSEDLKRMIAAVNANLEAGLSPRSFKWRLQALLSKRSYTEILLANTYIFHVSHVFLIHRETGILLNQEIAEESSDLESDLISGMLTAIRDFVQDSFKNTSSGSLDTVQVGDLNILVEQGPHAIIAAIVEGQPPADFRLTLAETIEAVHFNHAIDLEKFDGSTKVFVHTSKFLKNCLIKQKKEKKNNVPWPLIFLLTVIFALSVWFIYKHFESKNRFNTFVEKLDALPGYHITKAEKSKRKFNVYGLKDFQAPSYATVFEESRIDTTKLLIHFEPFISLEPSMVLKRAENILNPPSSVEMQYESGKLILNGEADDAWVKQAIENVSRIYGVIRIDTAGLNMKSPITNLEWIIPAIEKYTFIFEVNVVSLNSVQQQQFDSLVKAAVHLGEYNSIYNRKLAIYVRSYTSRTGNVDANMRIALKRAESFSALLKEAGLADELLEAQALFMEDVTETQLLRSVRFEVFDKSEK
jgi:outer membrane protein OmpA-like peptidoglycan-associated protein